MSNFSQSVLVDGKQLSLAFSLIHYPHGERYLVIVTDEGQPVASFYFDKTGNANWKLFNRFKTVPDWVHPLVPQLVEALTRNYNAGQG